ncbi:sensor histidine kinase [Butyricicoccus faecihominis]|uniref:sensor histidine kinase n=1 Tax=Butyricicoccus faecihominis TaxID=1712515 RepID=UPI0024798AE1|nr:sensor histidine kinase [Butyricicoccus faecihominis]MCQ5130588.1 sensor histidine kinase [Butyricicoccus faecihominis]
MDLVEHQVQQVNEFAIWLEQNETLQKILALSSEEAANYTEDNYSFKKQIRTQVYASPVAQNILSLFIIGENGLDIRSGSEAALIDLNALVVLAQPATNSTNGWYMLTNNLTEFSENELVIAYTRRLPKLENGKDSGTLVILFSADMLSNAISELGDPEEYQIILRNTSGSILAVKGGAQKEETFELKANSLATGWSMTAKISSRIFDRQWQSLMQSAMLLILVAVCVVAGFAVFLSRDFARPIERVIDTVDHIAHGEFVHVERISSNNEIARLGRHINTMTDNIQELIREQIQHEQEKKHMEMKMLQTQMNPHFLYNTLSSIKLMANMQGKSGISKMIEMLGRMLRANLSIETELIPLRQELELLDSYVYLQNIRLNGKIDYARDDIPTDVLELPVLKFLLQPLVENAILHGISPRAQKGKLSVSARMVGGDLIIGIEDNGVGMNTEELERARGILCGSLSELVAEGGDGHGIALGNVLARLRLQYGPDCEIVLHSIKDQGTTVILRLPIEKERDKDA